MATSPGPFTGARRFPCLRSGRTYLHRQILPAFAGRPIADITRQDVHRWFASLRTTPFAADRSMPVLSVIMKEADLMGYRPEGSNPCRGIRRYRRKGRERFLSDDEIECIAARLSAHQAKWPVEVAVVRLLMLTGCRKCEVSMLRWSDYRAGHMFLRDSKTEPRTVWLSRAPRTVLEHIPRTGAWMFPQRCADRPRGRSWPEDFWRRVRPVPVVSRLLGHSNVRMTLRYAHLADKDIEAAAERIGAAMARVMALG